jgi:integrase
VPEYRLTRYRGKFAITFADGSGKRRRLSTGTADPLEAARELERFRLDSAAPVVIGVDGILDEHLKKLEGRAWSATAIHQVKPLRKAFGGLLPMQITEDAVKAYVASRIAAGRAPQTVRNEISVLASALNHAMNKRLIAERPHIAFPQGSPPREHRLTREQFRAMMDATTTPHVRLFLALAIGTGARSAAILDLTWGRVDITHRTIDLRVNVFARMKGRAVVPINDALLSELEKAHAVRLSDAVIEHGGKRIHNISKGVKEAGKRIGCPWLSPHVLRHSAAVWMAEAGNPMSEIAQYLGHRDSGITERVYSRFSPTHLRKAAQSLEW